MAMWRQVKGFPNYAISADGDVKNVVSGLILKKSPDYAGRERVSMIDADGHKRGRSHRKLMQEHFVEIVTYTYL